MKRSRAVVAKTAARAAGKTLDANFKDQFNAGIIIMIRSFVVHPSYGVVDHNEWWWLTMCVGDEWYAISIGRLLACISSRPGQSGRADGYLLEGDELAFYLKKLQKKK